MYVQPVAGNVIKIMSGKCHVSELVSICLDDTLERTSTNDSKEGMSRQEEGAPSAGEGTYTERSSESSSEIKNEQQQSARDCAVTFFKENGFGNIGSYLQEKINAWCEKLSGSLVVEAMKKAAGQGKQYWSYVEAILKKWELSGVKDVKDAEEKESDFMKQKFAGKGRVQGQKRKPMRTEKLPDWFTGEQCKDGQVDQGHDEEFEAEKAELLAELAVYRERGSCSAVL
jgi:DnaD/phage-associated family protein